MSILKKPIHDITFDDVIDFCDQNIPEGFGVEYKKIFPKNESLAKEIAAFANTHGGILIIGIDAPNAVPKRPYTGIDYSEKDNLLERIDSVCFTNITEPVFPEVQIARNDSGDKAFVIVRIQESENAPHRTNNNTRVYVRTGQSSTPLEQANWENVEWLIGRRKKAEQLREILRRDVQQLFETECLNKGINIEDENAFIRNSPISSTKHYPL